MRRWDASSNTFVDVQLVRRYDADLHAFIDVQGAYITEAGVRRQVWPVRKYLYKAGDECNEITGGWIPSKIHSTDLDFYDSVAGTGKRVVTNTGTYIYLYVEDTGTNGTDGRARASICTQVKVDMVGFTKLYARVDTVAEVVKYDNTLNSVVLYALTSSADGLRQSKIEGYRVLKQTLNAETATERVLEADVSQLMQSYYITFMTIASNQNIPGDGLKKSDVKIREIWLET